MWQRIREARKSAGLSQQQVADHFGIQRPAVSQWEASDPGKRTTPGTERLAEFADLTKCGIEWLISGVGSKSPSQPAPDINSPNHLAASAATIWGDAECAQTLPSDVPAVAATLSGDELEWLQLYHELPPEQREAIKTIAGKTSQRKE